MSRYDIPVKLPECHGEIAGLPWEIQGEQIEKKLLVIAAVVFITFGILPVAHGTLIDLGSGIINSGDTILNSVLKLLKSFHAGLTEKNHVPGI